MKRKRKILSLLLIICLAVGLLPTAVFAVDSNKTIMLNTGKISGYNATKGYDYIYYGTWNDSPIKWRVLDDQTNTGGKGFFLLSEELLGNSEHGDVYFQHDYNQSGTWQGSDAQTWCQKFEFNNFNSQERAAILETTKSDEAYPNSDYPNFSSSKNILNGDKVFFLSAEEAYQSNYGFDTPESRQANYLNDFKNWWLRSPTSPDKAPHNTAALVYRSGNISYQLVSTAAPARPAFNLDVDSILFVSAAKGGKIPAASSGEASGAIFEVAAYNGNEWKPTLLDNDRYFAISNVKTNANKNIIDFSYSNACIGANEYISVVIVKDGEITHYGRILQLNVSDKASGTTRFTLPAGIALDNNTKLYVFNEQCNGGTKDDTKKTDYGSKMIEVNPTVVDVTPSHGISVQPTELEFGSKMEGYTEAPAAQTVTITNTENQQVTVILPSSTQEYIITGGTDFTNGTATLAPNQATTFTVQPRTGLGKGDHSKQLTISVQGNSASVGLSFEVLEKTYYTLTVNLNGGSGSTTGGEYLADQVVNIDAGSRSNYRFDRWISSNGGSFANASNASTTFTMPAADTTITATWSNRSHSGSSGSSYNYYIITTSAEPGGSISPSGRISVRERLDKNFTITPDCGYCIADVLVDGESIGNVTNYTFENVRKSHTIKAVFAKNIPGIGVDNPFTDVHPNDWFYEAVMFVYQNTVMRGTSATTFSPYDATTRAQIATIFYRMAGRPAVENTNTFTDVPYGPTTYWYYDAVLWAQQNGIMHGYGNNLFGPNDPVTREQLAVVFYNYAKLKGYDTTTNGNLFSFIDIEDLSPWAQESIKWAVGSGVISGKGSGILDPKGNATRAEIAAMIQRFIVKNNLCSSLFLV